MPADDTTTELFQHYRVLRRDDGSLWKLGAGAMGVTYKAIDTNLDAPVALKVINAIFTGSDSARERFIREAKAAASLRHRNVASVYHLGRDAQSFFYAMEFIDGETVEHLVAREGPQSWRVALPAALQVARALMAAHEKRLVHRDIKPANVMLVREVGEDDLTVKLIDFGLAKTLVEEGGSVVNVTGTGFLGTPLYASPEQCEEIAPDIRSDIYSLGVTLWFVLAGRPPFQGGLGKVFAQHLHAPPPWDQLPASVPAPVRALLARMLAKGRDERPQTPADLRREIEACLRESGQSVPVLPGSEAPPLRPAPAPPAEPIVAETLLDTPPDTEPPGFTLEDALRQHDGRLPAALVAELLTPLARIIDAAAPAALDLAPNAVRVVAAPPGSTPHAAAFTDPWLTGGQPGRLELRPADAARSASPSVNETLPPRRAGFHAPAAALAALAYELIGGRPPDAGQGYRPLAECGEAANRHLRRALAGGTAGFADAGAFAAAFAGSLDQRAGILVPAAAPTPLPAAPPPPKKKRGCAVNVVVTVVAALLVVAVVGKLAFAPGAGPSAAPTAAPIPTPDVRLPHAKEAIEAARVEIKIITNDFFKASALLDIAVAQAKAGDVAGALQTAEGNVNDFAKALAQSDIAAAQAKAGDVAGARQTAGGIISDFHKTSALSAIAVAQAKAGDVAGARQSFAQALQTAGAITVDYTKASALRAIAVAQAQAGDVAGARQTIGSITDDSNKTSALSAIAVAQAKAGDVAGARQTVGGITVDYIKTSALNAIAVAQAKAGDVAGARQTVGGITSVSDKAPALIAIAVAQAKAGDVAGARQTIGSITDGSSKFTALIAIAVAQVKVGDVAGALQTVGGITDDSNKTSALIAIAVAQAKAGDVAGARQSFAQALQTAGSITNDYTKASALRAIAATQARAGDMAGAEGTVKSLAPGIDRCRGYLAIANALLAGPDAPDDDP